MTFTTDEVRYLRTQLLARLATVAPDGVVQNSPVGFEVNLDQGTVEVRGRDLPSTKKFANIVANPQVALVVDDLASTNPWRPRGIEIRGVAEASADEPPAGHFGPGVIRIHPRRIISWGLGEPAARMTARNITK